MNSAHVDDLLHSLKSAVSRRGLLSSLTGGVLVPGVVRFGEGEAEAKKGSGKNRGRKNRRQKRRKNDTATLQVAARCDVRGTIALNNLAFADSRVAQTFVADLTGPLVRAELELSRFSDSVGDITLRLSPVDGDGKPTNDVLAETSVPVGRVSVDSSVIPFVFGQPATVEAGMSYSLVLSSANGGLYFWGGELTNACEGEALQSDAAAGAFSTSSAGLDLNFTAFVGS